MAYLLLAGRCAVCFCIYEYRKNCLGSIFPHGIGVFGMVLYLHREKSILKKWNAPAVVCMPYASGHLWSRALYPSGFPSSGMVLGRME